MNNKQEITLNYTLTKTNNNDAFNRAKLFESEEEYLKYLFELDRRINGTDNEICGYKTPEDVCDEIKDCSITDLEAKIDLILQDILGCVDYVEHCIPENAKLASLDKETGLMFIPEDDALFTTKLLVDELIEIRKLIKSKEGK